MPSSGTLRAATGNHPGGPEPARWLAPAGFAAAVVTAVLVLATGGLSIGGTSKASVVLPLAVGVALVLGLVAITRFHLYVMALLVLRSSLDLAKLSGRMAGKEGVARSASRALDPASLLAVLFLVAAAFWLAAQYRQRGSLPGSPLRRALVFFAAAGALSVLGAAHPVPSALEALRICAVVVMFVVLEQMMRDPVRMRQLLTAAFLSVVFPLAYTTLGFLTGNARAESKGGFTRVVGTFNQSNDFARYLMLLIVMGVALYPYLERRWRRPLAGMLSLMSVFLLLTYTRSALVATGLGLLVVGVLQSRRVIAGLLVAGVAALLVVPSLASRFGVAEQEGKRAARQSGNSLVWRLDYWTEVLPLANSNPVTGIGLTMTKYTTDEAKQPHNDFVRAYVETGLIGLGAYLTMIVSLIGLGRRAVRRAEPGTLGRGVAVGFLGCTVAFVAVSTVANVISNVVNLWYFFTFAAAASVVARGGSGDDAGEEGYRGPTPVEAIGSRP